MNLNNSQSHICLFFQNIRGGADEQQQQSAELHAEGEEETPAGAAGPGHHPDRWIPQLHFMRDAVWLSHFASRFVVLLTLKTAGQLFPGLFLTSKQRRNPFSINSCLGVFKTNTALHRPWKIALLQMCCHMFWFRDIVWATDQRSLKASCETTLSQILLDRMLPGSADVGLSPALRWRCPARRVCKTKLCLVVWATQQNVHSNAAAACVFSRSRVSNYAFDLSLSAADLDRQLAEAQAATELLRAEQLFVSQRPLTDRTCLRWVASAVTAQRTDLCSHTQETHCIVLLQSFEFRPVTQYILLGAFLPP